MTNWPSVVDLIKDGQDVSELVVNQPLSALVNRTQYLYERLEATYNNARLMAMAQPVASGSGVAKYSVVYYDGTSVATPGLKLTSPKLANLSDFPFFRGADSAHVFGIVTDDVSNDTANVCLQGLISVPNEDVVAALLASPDATFKSGPLYLSSTQAGKLTPIPNGLAIYVAYAKSRSEVYINPSQESLSELFWTFRYAVLDRPAGEISFNAGSGLWSMSAPSTTKVGWVRATDRLSNEELTTLFPDGVPTYFYQLPDRATIESADNEELTAAEKQAAIQLRAAFPVKSNSFSLLSVNGVVLTPRQTAEDRGSYLLNELGLWWFKDPQVTSLVPEADQPWSDDLPYSLVGDTVNTTGQNLFLTSPDGTALTNLDTTPGFNELEVVRFFTVGGALPAPLADNVDYVLKNITSTHFSVAAASTPSTIITLSNSGSNWYLKWKPTFWRLAKGSVHRRPLMQLQFTKLNPDARQNMVTSLQTDRTVTTPAVELTSLVTGEPANVGDLKLKFNLGVVNGWDGQSTSLNNSKAVKGIFFNEATEQLELALGNVVSEIRNGGGLRIDRDSSGLYTISFANAYANVVSDIEPEQSRLEYLGLNSFLALDYSTTPSGFIGKFTLPDQLVAGSSSYLSLIMTLFGRTSPASVTAKGLRFKFEYAVGHLARPLSATTTVVQPINFDLPLVGSTYTPNTTFETAATAFRIPVSELSPKATVNFRISRLKTDPTASLYSGVVGVTNVYWSLT
ncbi:hypothetical protein EKK58_01335 [Candidatus Dependentiae bacterium]|nr:MAG: hypothetical protein EKK58_01335 [Candidatus Dependentiae bacterium]